MKKMRRGFTLVELLVVIAILGALSAAMAVSSSNATAAAKATTIYNNISAIKTAAVLYQLQERVVVGIVLKHVLNVTKEGGGGKRVVEIDRDKPGQTDALLYDGRHDEESRQGERGKDGEQSHDDAEDAELQPASVLQEEHEGINHVGQNPGNEERQQDAGQTVDEQNDGCRGQSDKHPAHDAVESNLTF